VLADEGVTMRLTPIEKPPSLLGRLLDRVIRRTLGRPITPSQLIYNRVPAGWRISLAFQLFERYGAKLPQELLLLLATRVAMLNGCAFCQDIKRAYAIRTRLGTRRFDALADWRNSELFDERERAALAYVEEATRSKVVSDATFAALAKHFDEREIAEITLANAIENFYNLLSVPLEVEADGLEALAVEAGRSARAGA
jgi:alkylhydroperoxidase family enzyme